MTETNQKDSQRSLVLSPVFWAWAQQQAAPEEPLRLTRERALRMQMQADADLAIAVHRESFLAIVGVPRR